METKHSAPGRVGSDSEPPGLEPQHTSYKAWCTTGEPHQLGYGVFDVYVEASQNMNPSLLSLRQPPHENFATGGVNRNVLIPRYNLSLIIEGSDWGLVVTAYLY
jgi:hypothetical protein